MQTQNNMTSRRIFFVIGIIFLITGNLIGAGILGLPVNTGLSGFFPSLAALLIIGGAMLFSAIVLSGEAVREKAVTFNYPSLYHKYLGSIGKWVAIIANLIILYGLLTAYLTGATTIIINLFNIQSHHSLVLILFFLVITPIGIAETKILARFNGLLVVLLLVTFFVLVFMTGRHSDFSRLNYFDWRFLPMTVLIIVTSFHFHNIIPNICRELDWKMSSIWKVIFAGMAIGFVMNMLWTLVTIGTLPLSGGEGSIYNAFVNDQPATIPLSEIIRNPQFITCAMAFAMLAIVTSYITNAMGLLSFYNDLFTNYFRKTSRMWSMAFTFGPPFFIALFYPNIFLDALNVVGGVGIVMLFGILPSILVIKHSRTAGMKMLGVVVLILFAGFFLFEILQEVGLLHIRPEAEYWNLPAVHHGH